MKIGDLIGNKYLIEDEIGEGGMGKVFRVTHEGNSFALKICTDLDEESVKRFKREVRLMNSVNHENVIEILEMNLDNDPPYFVMPLCQCSLDDKLGQLQNKHELALKLLFQVCKGINAIHLSGIIHRDIKPKNILISHDRKIKISDLGLGKFSTRDSSVITSSNSFLGTQGYIPPEFFIVGGTKNADIRSDIYQLGKTIYRIFTNSNPILIEKNKLPGGILYIVNKSISDNPADRYQTIGDLENALNSYLLSLNPQNNPISALESSINVAKDNLRNNSYDKSNIEDIVKTLFVFKDDPDLFFKNFNKIPKPLLGVIGSNLPVLCRELLGIYLPTIDKYFRETKFDFSDAEKVAYAMQPIFNECKEMDIKIISMQITLMTSVYCHRFAAMEVFDAMIQTIKNDQDAVATSEMLRELKDYYRQVADRVPPLRLNHLIRAVQTEMAAENAEENARRKKEIDDIDY